MIKDLKISTRKIGSGKVGKSCARWQSVKIKKSRFSPRSPQRLVVPQTASCAVDGHKSSHNTAKKNHFPRLLSFNGATPWRNPRLGVPTCTMFHVSWFMVHGSRFMFHGSCFTVHVSFFSCFMFHMRHVSHASCFARFNTLCSMFYVS